ncbi:hypothetical protein L9F63_006817 [Diploptera punctata]|uniref:Uncharacterized protein n=1 Tax=Diploptera punctata TaxID=6984 RepID=A0AAD7Z9Z3_DIPPU|nr:hypothetical protein L9F63_006817 [Diploptera punctata]
MSVFFFRLHNLRREEENKKRKKTNSGSSSSTGGGMQQRRISVGRHRYHSTRHLGTSRLFERTPLTPSDSLDEIALQIPRCQTRHLPVHL